MAIPVEDELLPVRVMALLMEPNMNSPVVILHEPEDNRVLPIWVGEAEARSIAVGLGELEVERPLTHMVAANVMEALGGELFQVAIEEIQGGTYFASLFIDNGRKKPLVIDVRPSDAIALALEFGAEIFVAKSVLDAAGQDNPFPSDSIGDVAVASVKLEMNIVDVPAPSAKSHLRYRKPSSAKTNFSEEEADQLKAMLDRAREMEANNAPEDSGDADA